MKDKWDQVAEHWKQFSSEAKKKWDELTEDDLSKVDGSRTMLVDFIQKRYNITKKIANKQVDVWTANLKV